MIKLLSKINMHSMLRFFGLKQKLETVSYNDYDAIVVSFGGAGTTMLLRFLAPHLKVNNENSYVDGLKHICSPDHPILNNNHVKKAIYLICDPRDSVLSFFRRKYAQDMMIKLNAQYSTPQECNRMVSKKKTDVKDLADFIEIGDDIFGIKEHWKQWSQGSLDFPVLFINYENIHDSIDQILEFLELPTDLKNTLPARRQRNTVFSELPPKDQAVLNRIYEDMANDIANRPGVFIRQKTRTVGSRKG